MKYLFLLTLWVALLLIVLTGCDKANESQEFEAHYTGTFVRTDRNPLNNPVMANVNLVFTKNKFSGTSNLLYYPAICSGAFTISQTKMVVNNTCVFTANFDWTYIFKGEYNYEQNGNQLHIWRTNPDGTTDSYQLIKQK